MSNQEGQSNGMSGCAIAAIIVGVLGVLVVGGVLVAITMVMRSAPAQGLVQTMNAAAESMSGPAPDAMRAIGCANASSMDMAPIASMVRAFAKNDPKALEESKQLDGMFQASCSSDTLSCEQVFTAWNRAAPANATHVVVTVV